ncbi:MAG: Phosphate starvation-inducible ATPase PhoH with binding motif [Micavibrio sp.]|nr:Phosphate starvation-inducible ATPase PhoH with binding motif [Micavibrio sp.]
MTFGDNRLLPALFGEQNSHLSDIEKAFDVTIHGRGNQVMISGKSADTKRARDILSILWNKLQEGDNVDDQTVDAALRFSLADKDSSMTNTPHTNLKDFASVKGQISVRKKNIAPRSPMQAQYIEMMQSKEAVFGIGPAGTGKTYLAVAQAVALFEQEKIERIILSRPAVEAGERLGFLPGDLKEKIDPYLRPLYDALYDTMGAEKAEKRILAKDIEIAPLAFMRGRTLTNAFVILDEAQNTTSMQMKMFLTRLGEGSRMVITGDPSQIDLPKGETSGLMEAVGILQDVDAVGIIHFGSKDIVRSSIVQKIVNAYDARDGKNKS